ncbi:hypothetical protein VOLCADRAFT_92472 [Volvox carteri f. nagariensis]|uniref:K Homology domain-containing protein n=1 Tax=Volvox carteri f. nagariensis TaxID=3068 RepID=D8TZR4_VOLCA|nr:uncharacterized protein VOLCADRAFT_92472 [Volvox carteri f. nagariensis]EFJ46968.1 hypothetical protein VOLCADRAFT_92472 [Volvox carteri f. nagariensis]|eukprot:XP_002951863.1 hypothetical protein VOLCADRAFT_92472 [Volvox carteri f. nagariensis]
MLTATLVLNRHFDTKAAGPPNPARNQPVALLGKNVPRPCLCPRKNGETVKALQTYTGATIQIDQSVDPTRVSISGAAYSVNLAVSIVTDIIRADSLQHVYPLMTTGLPTQNVLALQTDAALAQPGTMSLVNAQLQQLAMPGLGNPGGDLGALAGGGIPYPEAAYMPAMLPMAGAAAHGNHGGVTLQPIGGSEEFAMSASHRLIQAAGGGRGAVRPKSLLG